MASPVCPICQKTIPGHSPSGLCPDCLLAQGLGEFSNGGGPAHPEAAFAVTTPQGSPVIAHHADQLAQYFPQLEGFELIGQGGMGAVYKARQKKLDRMVAVKIIRQGATRDPAFAERFLREARTLARLTHASIVGVHDFGEIAVAESGDPPSRGDSTKNTLFYFVMEFVDGANLRQLMQSGTLSPELAMSIIPQVCEALQYAHDEGVVHRDIKPENILLDSRGRVKIADFGLAKLSDKSATDWTLTGTHQVMGTPRYMAPEQMAGSKDVDHRADIYSLGVVFYEMLTGSIPAGHFAPPSHRSKVDARLDEVVLKAMASEPGRRFQAARDLQSSVQQIASSSSATPHRREVAELPGGNGGFSTIIDREAVATWRLFSGDSEHETTSRAGLPVLLILLLSIAGLASLALPWFRIPSVTAEITAGEVSEAGLFRDVRGYQLWSGVAAGIAFGVLPLMCLMIPAALRLRFPVTATATMMAGLVLVATLLSLAEVRHPDSPTGSLSAGRRPAIATAVAGTTNAASSPSDASSPPAPALLPAPESPETAMSRVTADSPIEVSAALAANAPRIATGFALPLSMSGLLLVLSGAALRRSFSDAMSVAEMDDSQADSVTVTRQEAIDGVLPDLCLVCGHHTTNRVKTSIQYQAKWAQALMILGFIAGGIPGVIIAIVTVTETPITGPLCRRHRNHWRRIVLFGSLGWLLPILAGGLGFLTATLLSGSVVQFSNASVTGLVVGLVAGLATYVIPLIYLCSTSVKCEQTNSREIMFSRVSSTFAAAVRSRQMNSR